MLHYYFNHAIQSSGLIDILYTVPSVYSTEFKVISTHMSLSGLNIQWLNGELEILNNLALFF